LIYFKFLKETLMERDYKNLVEGVIPIQQKVQDINPALGELYPVAVVEDDQFLVYDIQDVVAGYRLAITAPTPMPIQAGIRAAFQLEVYHGKIACVVTPDAFDSIGGYITILHEFVHCYQYETCEQDLKMQLDIAQKAAEDSDFMWEIEHPFPYLSKDFSTAYLDFLDALERDDVMQVLKARQSLREYLGVHDFEYMLWQEWKEGFARWVENKIKQELGQPINQGGIAEPFSRVLFYAGGEAYISWLVNRRPTLANDLPALFYEMKDPGLG
jgi:hypothetical protein